MAVRHRDPDPGPRIVDAVLLDLGGVFYLPDHDRMRGALARVSGSTPTPTTSIARTTPASPALDDAPRGRSRTGTRPTDFVLWLRVQPRVPAASVRRRAPTNALRRAHDEPCSLEEFGRGDVWTREIPGAATRSRDLAAHGRRARDRVERRRHRRGAAAGRRHLPGRARAGRRGRRGARLRRRRRRRSPTRRSSTSPSTRSASRRTRAIHVGDMPAADVAGARAAGVRPVLVDPYDLHAHLDCPASRTFARGGAGPGRAGLTGGRESVLVSRSLTPVPREHRPAHRPRHRPIHRPKHRLKHRRGGTHGRGPADVDRPLHRRARRPRRHPHDEPTREAERAQPATCSSGSPTATRTSTTHDDVRCAILTGAGGSFSSGIDLDGDEPAVDERVRRKRHGRRARPPLEGPAARLPAARSR